MSNDIASGNAIEVNNLSKSYPGFTLDHISFTVPRGRIVGCIGENGAGKTTTIDLMLGLLRPDSGEVKLLGLDMPQDELEIKKRVAAVPDDCPFPVQLTARDIGTINRHIYPAWDEARYKKLLHDFRLPDNKKIQDLSRGMKAKLALAAAVSQSPDLLVLDEATTGLDVGARDDMEAMLLDFIQDQQKAVFFSTHLTEDLARIADHILLIHGGRVVFQEDKDTLLDNWGIVKTSKADAALIPTAGVVARKEDRGISETLVRDRHAVSAAHPELTVDAPSLDDILLFYIKGETR